MVLKHHYKSCKDCLIIYIGLRAESRRPQYGQVMSLFKFGDDVCKSSHWLSHEHVLCLLKIGCCGSYTIRLRSIINSQLWWLSGRGTGSISQVALPWGREFVP